MPVGRPTKYRPEMCDTVVELMSEGASKAEVCLELGIHHDTWGEWEAKYPEFSAAIKKGSDSSQGWWEKNGRVNLENKDFNATLWYMNMKNRHGWADKHDHTSSDGSFTGRTDAELLVIIQQAAKLAEDG